MFSRIKAYFAGARQEFKFIQWPNFTETRRLTLVVIIMALGLAVFLGAFDYLFTYILEKFILVF